MEEQPMQSRRFAPSPESQTVEVLACALEVWLRASCEIAQRLEPGLQHSYQGLSRCLANALSEATDYTELLFAHRTIRADALPPIRIDSAIEAFLEGLPRPEFRELTWNLDRASGDYFARLHPQALYRIVRIVSELAKEIQRPDRPCKCVLSRVEADPATPSDQERAWETPYRIRFAFVSSTPIDLDSLLVQHALVNLETATGQFGGWTDMIHTAPTEFTLDIYIPASLGPEAKLHSKPLTTKDVLVVEPDPDVRGLLQLLLEQEGYRPRLASDSGSGLQLIEQSETHISLVLLDRPRDERQLVAVLDRLESIDAETNILLLSTSWEAPNESVISRLVGFLPKPFPPEHLLGYLRSLESV